MTIITFKISDEMIVEHDGKLPKSRIAFRGAGIEIYVVGVSKYHHPDCVPNMAMNACIARHIPVISLRREK